MKRGIFVKIFNIITILFFVVSVVLIGLNIRHIQDYFRANNFKPSQEILSIVSKIKPKDNAKQIFYATNPRVLSTDEFNQQCNNSLEKTTVLGCYKSDEIFIFNVNDSELDGIKEVTAAHELLHAVWARMSDRERENLKGVLRADYERLKTPSFEKIMANYAKTQPGEHENELHSILGTEWADLSPELEQHYAEIFENRREIVAMNLKYKSKFEALEKTAENLDSELKRIKSEITAEQSDYEAKLNILNDEIADFNEKSKNGSYSDVDTFRYNRQKLASRVDFLRKYKSDINSKIADFNEKAVRLSEISMKLHQLYDSIDSNFKNIKDVHSL